jgi:hypothetical protein
VQKRIRQASWFLLRFRIVHRDAPITFFHLSLRSISASVAARLSNHTLLLSIHLLFSPILVTLCNETTSTSLSQIYIVRCVFNSAHTEKEILHFRRNNVLGIVSFFVLCHHSRTGARTPYAIIIIKKHSLSSADISVQSYYSTHINPYVRLKYLECG